MLEMALISSLPQVDVHRNGMFRHSNLGCKKWQSAQETLSGRSMLDASVANTKSLVVLLDSQVLVRMLWAKDSRTEISGIMFHIPTLVQWQNQFSPL
ncbi:hypothetical protein DY000_02033786 [Brassica cretica]|nr:hypothetical protein DY000_02033786 [Brassica cretica]